MTLQLSRRSNIIPTSLVNTKLHITNKKINMSSSSSTFSLDVPPESLPTGMKSVHINQPFQSTALSTIDSFGAKKVFVLANNSSRRFIVSDEDGEMLLVNELQQRGILAAPLCTSIGMGGGELGLLQACDEAYKSDADCVVTVGGGAVQDAGKFIRLWLSTRSDANKDDNNEEEGGVEKASVKGLQAASSRDPMPELPPQIALPNSFAMAEPTSVAGLTTTDNIKSGAAHPSLIPTVIIYDPALSEGLPDWVRFGTAARCVEHAIGAITHPKANEEIRKRALEGLRLIHTHLLELISNPECKEAQSYLYLGGFEAVRALSTGCYPALGHLVENHYSARFNVHQGSCSGILSARIMQYHLEKSKEYQVDISKCLGAVGTPAPRLVRDLIAKLPGVSKEHAEENVTDEMIREFAVWEWKNHSGRLNQLSPKPFGGVDDVFRMLTLPLEDI